MGEPDARIGRCLRELVEHHGKAHRRRRAKPVLAQEPAQQIPCAVRRAPAERHQRGAIERQPEIGIGPQGIRAIEAREIVMEPRRLGLRAAARARVAG